MEQRRRSSLIETERLGAMKDRRKSSVHQHALERAIQDQKAIVEAGELSAEDRKLAELGYKQVCSSHHTREIPTQSRTGVQT